MRYQGLLPVAGAQTLLSSVSGLRVEGSRGSSVQGFRAGKVGFGIQHFSAPVLECGPNLFRPDTNLDDHKKNA